MSYFLNSGKQAVSRSAMAEAITQLQIVRSGSENVVVIIAHTLVTLTPGIALMSSAMEVGHLFPGRPV